MASATSPIPAPAAPVAQHVAKDQDKAQEMPDRVMVAAFKFLSIEGLGCAARVNKKWNFCVGFNSDQLWKEVRLDYPLLTTVDEREWRKLDCNALEIDPSGAPQFADRATLKAIVIWLRRIFNYYAISPRDNNNGAYLDDWDRPVKFPGVIDLTLPKGYGNETCMSQLPAVLRQRQKEGSQVGSKPIDPAILDSILFRSFANLDPDGTTTIVSQTERIFVTHQPFTLDRFLRNCPNNLRQMQGMRELARPPKRRMILGYQQLGNGQRLDYVRKPQELNSATFGLRLANNPDGTLPEGFVEVPDEESIFKPKQKK